MRPRTLSWVGVILLGLTAGGTLLSNHRRAAGLRHEIDTLRLHADEVRRIEAERDHLLASQPDANRLAALRSDRHALERVRAELGSLQNAVARLPNARTGEPAMIPAANWTHAGRATPAATVETALWSGRTGDVDGLAALLTFDEPVLARAKALFDRLPADAQGRHGSPERLIALLTARDATYESMQIAATIQVQAANLKLLQEVQPEVTGMVVVQTRVQARGQPPQLKTLVLRQRADGWRIAVPAAAVESYAAQLARNGP